MERQMASFVLTDSLGSLGCTPRGPSAPANRAACSELVSGIGGELVAHEAIWGGAIHFAEISEP